MTADDWTAIIIAGFSLAVFVATVLAIHELDAKIKPSQPPEPQFTKHTVGKAKRPNLLTCDDIMAHVAEHHRGS